MPRALWKGAISFGLVNIPVELFPAEERKGFSFSMLDKRDLAPVGYKRFNKSTGKETVIGETRFSRFRAVGLDGGRGFARDVHHFRHRHLHPVSQFILGNASLRFRMAEFVRLDFIQVAQGVEAHAPNVTINAGGIRSVKHRIAFRAALHALVNRGQEAAAERVLAPVRLHAARDQDNEAGEILVLRT